MKSALFGVATALGAALAYGAIAVVISYFTDRTAGVEPPGGWAQTIFMVPLYMTALSSPLTIPLGAVLGATLPRLHRHMGTAPSIAAAAAIAFAVSLVLFGAIKPTPESEPMLMRFASGLKEACWAALVGAAFTFAHRAGA